MTEPHATMTPGQSEDAAVQLENDFTDIVRSEIGMHEGMATVFAQALVRGLRRVLGGSDLYIPAPDRSERDAAIRRDFTGTNCDELMRKHGLSRTRIYEIAGQRPAAKSPALPLKTGQASE
jgi:Mor family transcriptional regulator